MRILPERTIMRWLVVVLGPLLVLACAVRLPEMKPDGIHFEVPSTQDETIQRCLFWGPVSPNGPRPMLVFLHSWSGNWKQDNSRWMKLCQQRDWYYLHPDFRGANTGGPDTCGSPVAQKDILDAIDFVSDRYAIDASKIFLAGTSGGGHMALLMAGRYPTKFAGVSAWCGISSLPDWHKQTQNDVENQKYAQHIQKACGGNPETSSNALRQALQRSPIHYLEPTVSVPIDINAGINDGHSGSVPISHSIEAFNAIVEVEQRVDDDTLRRLIDRNVDLSWATKDKSYGVEIHFRRFSADGTKRLTIFDGGHEDIPSASIEWFARYAK